MIQRWTTFVNCFNHYEEGWDELGKFVLYTDHLAALEATVKDATQSNRGCIGYTIDLERQISALTAERDNAITEIQKMVAESELWDGGLRAEIGTAPDGSHPDEQKPRDRTWHQERLNWQAECDARGKAYLKLSAENERLKEEVELHTSWGNLSATLPEELFEEAGLKEAADDLLANQEPLGDDFQAVLNEVPHEST